MTELDTTSDAVRMEASPPVAWAPRPQLVSSLSAPEAGPPVEEEDLDSMWEEGVCSW